MCVPWESNPQPFALLTQCSTTEPHRNTPVFPYTLHTNEIYTIYKMRICILGHVAIYDHKRLIAGSLWNEDLVNNSLQSRTGVFITFHHYIVLFLWPYNIQYRTTRLVKTKGLELNPVHWPNLYFYMKTQRWGFANDTIKVLNCVNGRESVYVLTIQVFLFYFLNTTEILTPFYRVKLSAHSRVGRALIFYNHLQ